MADCFCHHKTRDLKNNMVGRMAPVSDKIVKTVQGPQLQTCSYGRLFLPPYGTRCIDREIVKC